MADKSRKGLGKGLDSIFGTNVEQFLDDIHNNGKEVPGRREIEIAIDEIRANPYQPRKEFDEKALQDLSNSIKVHGIFTPLLVRKSQAKGYELIAGERRLRAAKLAGLTVVPAISVEFTDEEMMEISILENVQREDLNPIEEAQAYKRLLNEFHLKQDEVAERVSKSRTAVTNSMRLLKLSDDVQRMVIDEMITTGHARALLGVEDPAEQYNLAQRIFDEKLSVREVEKIVKNMGKPVKPKKEKVVDKSMQVIYDDISEKLKTQLGTKVNIVPKEDGSGKIEIEFYSHDELDRILDLMK